MLLSLETLIIDYKLKIAGVIHVGAHYGQEVPIYTKCGIDKVLWFEPQPKAFAKLLLNAPKTHKCFNLALGNSSQVLQMHIENNNDGQSSSFLPPKLHKDFYPSIRFTHTGAYRVSRLDDLRFDFSRYNMMNLDVQGYELNCLRGAESWLTSYCDYVYTEVNLLELYENVPLFDELHAFLRELGFALVEMKCVAQGWGDAFFVKRSLL